MTLVFSTPLTSVPGFFTYVSRLTLEAFSGVAGTSMLATVISQFNNDVALEGEPGSVPNELLQLAGLGPISNLRITGSPSGDSFTLDDLRGITSAPVTEPATLILVTTGVLAAWQVRRQRPRR